MMVMMVMIVIIVHHFPWWWNEANGHNGKSKRQMADGPQLHVQPLNKYKQISGNLKMDPLQKKIPCEYRKGNRSLFLITAFGLKPGLVSVLAIRNQCDWDSWQGRQLLNFCMVKQRHSTLIPLVIIYLYDGGSDIHHYFEKTSNLRSSSHHLRYFCCMVPRDMNMTFCPTASSLSSRNMATSLFMS